MVKAYWGFSTCLQNLKRDPTKKRLIERSLTHIGNGRYESSALVMWTGQTGSSGSGLSLSTLSQAGHRNGQLENKNASDLLHWIVFNRNLNTVQQISILLSNEQLVQSSGLGKIRGR